MQISMLLALPILALVATLVAVALFPKGRRIEASAVPSRLSLYVQAIWAALTKPKRLQKQHQGHTLEVCINAPHRTSFLRLQRYLSLVGFPRTLPCLPIMYPVVESFPLIMQAMLLPDFPFNVLGAVLARHSSTLYQGLGTNEALLYRVDVDTSALRTTAKGDTEVDIRCSAASPSSGKVVWDSVTTAIILNPRRSKGEQAAGQAPEAAASAQPFTSMKELGVVRLGPDLGRRYGGLNGDLNPIHLYPFTSQLFGFKRPIAHALCLTGIIEAQMRTKGGLEVGPSDYPVRLEATFKRPTLLPAKVVAMMEDVPAPATLTAVGRAVEFKLVTEDKAKEVLTGAILKTA